LTGGVMALRPRKFPAMGGLAAYLESLEGYLKTGDEKPISLFTIGWQRIERAYGQPLSADVRQGLVAATTSFVLFEESERTGSPISDVQATIKACRKQANEFQMGLPSLESNGDSYAQLLISKNFNNPPLGDRLFKILHDLLT